MINITEEKLKEIVTQAHMAGQHNQTGCDPSYFEAETHWQKQVKNLGIFSVVHSALPSDDDVEVEANLFVENLTMKSMPYQAFIRGAIWMRDSIK